MWSKQNWFYTQVYGIMADVTGQWVIRCEQWQMMQVHELAIKKIPHQTRLADLWLSYWLNFNVNEDLTDVTWHTYSAVQINSYIPIPEFEFTMETHPEIPDKSIVTEESLHLSRSRPWPRQGSREMLPLFPSLLYTHPASSLAVWQAASNERWGGWLWILLMKGGGLVMNTAKMWEVGTRVQKFNLVMQLMT